MLNPKLDAAVNVFACALKTWLQESVKKLWKNRESAESERDRENIPT